MVDRTNGAISPGEWLETRRWDIGTRSITSPFSYTLPAKINPLGFLTCTLSWPYCSITSAAVHVRGAGRPSLCRLPLGLGIRGTNTTMAFHSPASRTYPRSLRYRPTRRHTHWPTSTREDEREFRESNPTYSVGAMKFGFMSRTAKKPSTA